MTQPSPPPGHPGRIQPRTVAQHEKRVSIIPPQDLTYYEGQSPDFTLNLVPERARRVLDVGCGRGWLGRRLKARGVEEVVGIEPFADAAAEAREYLDVVYHGDVEAVAFDYPAGYFDCIVYSGVLEHLRDPWFTLYDHRDILADRGSVVALLPNVQHFCVLLDLFQGRWEYQSAGQLDATHYRFFTRHEIIRMFQETGYRLHTMTGHTLWDVPEQVRSLAQALKATGLTSPEFDQDLGVYIWTLRADKIADWQPAERRPRPLRIPGVGEAPPVAGAPALPATEPAPRSEPETSIVIVSYNGKADLEECLVAVSTQSRTRYEIIVVDNHSADGSAEWLQALPDVRTVLNDTNCGYSVAANQGLQLARGEYCILLDPDTVVTEGWDAKLVAHARATNTGAVGPLTHDGLCRGGQRAESWLKEPLPGDRALADVAGKFAAWYPGMSHETKLLAGFCLCVSRRVLDRVGLLDEELFLGNEDVELSLRLQWAGLRLRVALDTFVHHKGGRSLRTLPEGEAARYLQDSTDALYAKLEAHFGKGKVPSWPELLGVPWHLPSHLRTDQFTGERANPHSPNMLPDVMAEHWARYEFAQPYARGKRVLDAACGTGYGSAHLAEVAAHVTGWDVDPDTVRYARAKGRAANLHFGVGDVRTLPLADASFDLITSFETIEHVAEGRRVLAEFQRLLAPDGMVLISTPLGSEDGNPYHFAHYNRADFGPMLDEYFESVEMRYQREDRFSEESSVPLVLDRFAGEYALAICRRPKPVLPDRRDRGAAPDAAPRAGTPVAAAVAASVAAENGAEPPAAAADASPTVSVIIPAWNELGHTRTCIESIRAYTATPYEIIVVNNGSTDDTAAWLAAQADVHAIHNAENRGFAGACNQGLAAARGAYLCLLNNDTVVTPGWATRLIHAAERNARVGLVGPKANRVGGWQMDHAARYQDTPGLLAYAEAVAAERRDDWEDVPWLSGFCWLLPRETYTTVGPLDERFGLGTFEDNDYCLRVAQSGRRLLIAHDTFIHHQCSVTFTGAGIDYQEQMDVNRKIFDEKWGVDPTQLGLTAYKANRLEEARAHFETAIAETPEYADAHQNLAAVHIRARRWSPAAVALERLVELRPNQWPARVQLAKMYQRLGRAEEALAFVQPQLNAQHLAPALRAEALVVAGDVAAAAGEWDTAERAFRTALAAHDTLAAAWNGLGLVAHHAGRAAEARAAFERATTLDAEAADPLSNLGVMAWQAGDARGALVRFEAALDRDPVHAEALDNFVAAALAEGNVVAARARVSAALDLEPEWAAAQDLLAQCVAV